MFVVRLFYLFFKLFSSSAKYLQIALTENVVKRHLTKPKDVSIRNYNDILVYSKLWYNLRATRTHAILYPMRTWRTWQLRRFQEL